jgi:hypothetical protein
VERTPDTFTINVKAFGLFTDRQTRPNVLHKDIQEALATNGGKALCYRTTAPENRTELK